MNTDKRIQVRADDREDASGILSLLAAMPGVELRRERLSCGDYVVDESVRIERKSARDFAVSLMDGRLFAQATRLAAGAPRAALLLVGTAREWNELGISRAALQGALVTLMLIFDLPVFRALDAAEAARLLVYIGRQMARRRDAGHIPVHPQRKARRLLEHFGSVRACLNASSDDLQRVDGIGARTARAIVETVSGRI